LRPAGWSIWVNIALKTTSLNITRTIVRMVTNDLLTLEDVKEIGTVILYDKISLKMYWLILVTIMLKLLTKRSRWRVMPYGMLGIKVQNWRN
jgi:hypothetical protein